MGTGQNQKRQGALDVLRTLAVLLVLGAHMRLPSPDATPGIQSFASLWRHGGWIGVDLFFVLSGFLVGGLLFAEYRARGTIRLGRFFVRRAFKIYPAFYVFIAFVIATVALAQGGWTARWLEGAPSLSPAGNVLGELLFLQNYLGRLQWHTWSLAVEEHFYILLGVGVLAMARLVPPGPTADPFRRLPVIALAVCAATFALRLWSHARLGFDDWNVTFPTHLRLDSLLFGVMLAYFHHFHRPRLAAFVNARPALLAILALALIVPGFCVPLANRFAHTLGFTGLYVGFGGVVLLATHWAPFARALEATRLAKVGTYSYSVYLWHMVAQGACGALLAGQPWVVGFTAYVVASFAIGIAMAKVVEIPALRIRDRLFPARSPAPAVGPAPESEATDPASVTPLRPASAALTVPA